jgi:hypothetical protein
MEENYREINLTSEIFGTHTLEMVTATHLFLLLIINKYVYVV